MAIKILEISDKNIKYEVQSIDDFAKLMVERAQHYAQHPIIHSYAAKIMPKMKKNVPYNKEYPRLVYLIARDKIRYHREYSGISKVGDKEYITSEIILSPVAIIEAIKKGEQPLGDCDDKSLFIASMLLNKGFPVRYVLAHIKQNIPNEDLEQPNHIYVEYKEPGSDKWIPLDASGNNEFGKISNRTIPLKRYYAGYHPLMVSGIGEISIDPNVLMTAGNLLKNAGDIVLRMGVSLKEKKELPFLEKTILNFIQYIKNPFGQMSLATIIILIIMNLTKRR